jgi:hypothetical protein
MTARVKLASVTDLKRVGGVVGVDVVVVVDDDVVVVVDDDVVVVDGNGEARQC